jgi:undecaprenyl-diphosphatase
VLQGWIALSALPPRDDESYIMILDAIIMGLVEGLTEFLPVSSTGHLILMETLIGFKGPAGKVFEISIQLGAILAICWLYRTKLLQVAKNLPRSKPEQKFALNIILAFLPAAVLGFLFNHAIKERFFHVPVVATTMFLGGFVILAIEKWKPATRVQTLDDISPKRALLVGFCQALSMIPGVSRSGATIMGALLLGVERKTAAEFSFFLAIPTMFAATLYELFKSRHDLTSDGLVVIAVGFVTAFISALLVVKWFVGFISRHGFAVFAWYRIVIGSVLLASIIFNN